MIIGLYGRIGSGKSTFANVLKNFHDFEIVSLDKIAHDLLTTNADLIDDLRNNRIGTYAIDNNAVNFKKMTRLVFGSYTTNKAVSSDIWPYVKQVVDKLIVDANNKGINLVLEAATLPALNIKGIDQLVYIKRHMNPSQIIKICKEKHKGLFEVLNVIRIQKKYNRKYIKNSYVYKNRL